MVVQRILRTQIQISAKYSNQTELFPSVIDEITKNIINFIVETPLRKFKENQFEYFPKKQFSKSFKKLKYNLETDWIYSESF